MDAKLVRLQFEIFFWASCSLRDRFKVILLILLKLPVNNTVRRIARGQFALEIQTTLRGLEAIRGLLAI